MNYYQEPHATLYQGDALEVLKQLPIESVDMCVTSPPYYGLREYGMDGQLGLEKTPEEYVAKMVQVFREVRRVLKKEGTCWLNLGDSYNGSGGDHKEGGKNDASFQTGIMHGAQYKNIAALKPKDLIGIPWRVAFALQQPYYTGIIKDERLRYWLAALFDGEGCFGIRRQASSGNRHPEYNDTFIPYCSIKMSDRAPLDRAVEITGMGSVHEEPQRVGEDDRGINTTRTPYVWRLDGNKVVDLAKELYPYLLIKKPQTALIYTLDASNKEKKRGKGHIVPQSEMEYRTKIFETIKSFNQRDTDVLPEWCLIPPSLLEQGYYLRQDIIWSKPNPMPESVTDRCTKSHEYLFLLSKSAKYYYDSEAIKEEGNFIPTSRDKNAEGYNADYINGDRFSKGMRQYGELGTRNKRSVWEITTQPYSAKKSISFALADYVGHDGKPYKASEDCPVHGPMLRSGMFDRVANGGRLIHLGNHNLDNDNRHVSSQSSLPSAKTSHTHSATSESSTQRQTSESMTENKTLDHRPGYKLHEGTVDHNGHKLKSYESQDDNLDLQPHENVRSAKVRSKRSHKTGHVPVTNPSCNSSEGNAPHTDGKLIQSLMTGLDSSIPVNNNEQGDSSAHPSVQIPDHNVRISSQEQSYCKCKIMSIDHFATYPPALVEPCILAGCPVNGVALDPFAGSGTTLAVAKTLNRKSIGIELNPDYCKLCVERLQEIPIPMELGV